MFPVTVYWHLPVSYKEIISPRILHHAFVSVGIEVLQLDLKNKYPLVIRLQMFLMEKNTPKL